MGFVVTVGLLVATFVAAPRSEDDLAGWGFPVDGPEPSTSMASRGVISEPVVHLRRGPSVDTKILARLREGTAVTVLGEKKGWGEVKGWYRVRVRSVETGRGGWVAQHLVQRNP